jgi:hypothetical protein
MATEFKLVDVVARRRALDAEFKAEKAALDARFKPKIEAIDAYLMKYLLDNQQKTVSTEAGTVMTYKRRNIKVADFENFEAWATHNDKSEFIKHDVDSTEVLAYLDGAAGRLLPDGLSIDTTDILSVKAPKS